MPLTDTYERLPLASITIRRSERQRREIEYESLLPSVKARGVLNPVIVRREEGLNVLVAGERRHAASAALGLPDIPVRFAEDLTPLEARIIELEENIKREDLGWKDLVRAVAEIHSLYVAQDSGWTMGETAEAIGLSVGTISMYTTVNASLADEHVSRMDTVREAYNLLARRSQRLLGDALQELLESPEPAEQVDAIAESPEVIERVGEVIALTQPKAAAKPKVEPPPESILCASFLEWAPAYAGPKFNLIHCDFPFGIGLFDGKQGRGAEPGEGHYADDEELFRVLLECFCLHLDRFASLSAHLMFWYSARPGSKRERFVRETFARLAPSLDFEQFPLIWGKNDNAGIAGDSRRMPRHTYETCLLASRGKRQLVKTAGDFYSAPTDKRLHPSCKPYSVLRHFMQMLVDESTRLFDPTCGSASSLQAAESLGAKQVLGLENNPAMAALASTALRNSRLLRSAAKEI